MKLEKNHVVEISPIQKVDGELMPVKVSSPISLNEFIGKTLKALGPEKYFLYDSITDNCQRFIDAHLTANRLNSPAYKKFVVQDAYQLIQNDPVIQNLARKATDLAGLWDVILHGRGVSDFLSNLVRGLLAGLTKDKTIKYDSKTDWVRIQKSNERKSDIGKRIYNLIAKK